MTNGNDAASPTTEYTALGGNTKGGLTKREYFAAMAMQGILAGRVTAEPGDTGITANGLVKLAIADADALIAELNKKEITADAKT